jgi:hypothetical protein
MTSYQGLRVLMLARIKLWDMVSIVTDMGLSLLKSSVCHRRGAPQLSSFIAFNGQANSIVQSLNRRDGHTVVE